MNKKIVVVGIIGIFMLSGVTTLSAVKINVKMEICNDQKSFGVPLLNNRKTWYVDDNNTEGPWDGTVDHPYKKIKDAVENATESDEINVFSGKYYERITLDKELTLKGIDTGEGKPIIDGNETGTIINIKAENCVVNNFEIKRAGWELDNYGKNILIKKKNAIITNNDIIGQAEMGICLYSNAHNAKIFNNTIKKIGYQGIYNDGAENVNISYNMITDSGEAILLYFTGKNTVYRNVISSNDRALVLYYGGDYEVIENVISDHSDYGFIIYRNSYPNQVIGNVIYSNNGRALFLNENYAKISAINNTIYSNKAIGIEVWRSNNVEILQNTVYSNYKHGVQLSYSNKCKIIDNKIYSNDGHGIGIDDSDNLEIINNNIENNTQDGLRISWSNNNIIYHNNFVKNENNAYEIGTGLIKWDDGPIAGGNYWSDYDGIDENADGIGDTPYYISFPNKRDEYPIMKPDGWLNTPPDSPTIRGQTAGKADKEYEYTFQAVDPQQNQIYYYIDWNDRKVEDWIGPYESGEELTLKHAWSKEGAYVIKAKVKDIHDTESEWATLSITMPRNKQLNRFLILAQIFDI